MTLYCISSIYRVTLEILVCLCSTKIETVILLLQWLFPVTVTKYFFSVFQS